MLVAFVLDALILADRRPEHAYDLKDLLEEGCFDMRMIESYVERCGDVFDLFHPERPFLQTACPAEDSGGPVEALFAHIPCGSEAIHWHHIQEGYLSVSPAEAVRAMAGVSPFMKQGGRGYSPSINGSSPLYVMPVGYSLFGTLVLNLPLRPYGKSEISAAWTQGVVPQGRRAPVSVADGLTWQPRQLAIVVTEDARRAVRRVLFRPGFQIDGTSWVDPNLAYRWGDAGAEKVSMRGNRPLWRDAGALALLPMREFGKGKDKVSVRRPDVVEHVLEILDCDRSLCLRAFGLRAKQASIFEWTSSDLTVPAVLGKTRLGMIVERELQLAESGAGMLRAAILRLAPEFEREERKPPTGRKAWDKRSLRDLADRCERAYWQQLEREFHPLMSAFAALDPNAPDDPALVEATAKPWRESIRRVAREQFELAAKDMDADSDALKRQVEARALLNSKLRKELS